MGNERLRAQLQKQGMSALDLATHVEVDPKTVARWIQSGRVPHQRHRTRTSELLEAEETFLWPELLDDERARNASRAEILNVYPHRGAVPHDLWRNLIEKAEKRVDVLVFAGLFLLDSNPDLPTRLVEQAEEGLQGRFAYGNPDSEVVAWRGEEEGIGSDLAARIRLSLRYMKPAMQCERIEIRQHETVLYNSIYRFDDDMLVNTHVVGSPAPQNPVFHLQRIDGGHLFEHYLASFERVWDAAQPLAADGVA